MKTYYLRELIKIKNGKDYKGLNSGNVPVYGTGGIMTYVDEFMFDGESVLLPRKGSLANIMFVSGKFWTVDTMYWSEVNTEIVYPRYLYYYLSLLDLSSRDSGSTLPSMTFDAYYQLEIRIPDMKVQRRILDVLEPIDRKIEVNNRLNDNLYNYCKTIYSQWFLQYDYPYEGTSYRASGGKRFFDESIKKDIPVGWSVLNLEDIITTVIDHRGRTPKKMGGDWAPQGNGIMALSAKLVKNNTLNNLDNANWVTPEMYKKWMPEELTDGDILMTSEAPLGEFYYVKGFAKYCLSQRLFAIRANASICKPAYLFMYLSNGEGYQQIIGKQSGSTVFGIRQDELRKVKIILPPYDIQKQFAQIADPIFLLIRNNETETLQLMQQRDWLLPMLMNGQATVSN